MGKGKGSLDHWVCPVKRGRIIFEVEGVDAEVAKQAFQLAQAKLPIKTAIISREELA
jgi:large subunit ribosomal protein L16